MVSTPSRLILAYIFDILFFFVTMCRLTRYATQCCVSSPTWQRGRSRPRQLLAPPLSPLPRWWAVDTKALHPTSQEGYHRLPRVRCLWHHVQQERQEGHRLGGWEGSRISASSNKHGALLEQNQIQFNWAPNIPKHLSNVYFDPSVSQDLSVRDGRRATASEDEKVLESLPHPTNMAHYKNRNKYNNLTERRTSQNICQLSTLSLVSLKSCMTGSAGKPLLWRLWKVLESPTHPTVSGAY